MQENQIYIGNGARIAQDLPDNSIDLLVTSSPYHGARDYDVDRTFFDGDPTCDHVWIKDLPEIKKGRFIEKDDPIDITENKFLVYYFCKKCGCWWGKLGHEPDYKDRTLIIDDKPLTLRGFVSHLCDQFDPYLTKLKKTGSLILVIGDKFASRVCGSGGKKSTKLQIKGKTNFQAFAKPIKMQYDEPDTVQLNIPQKVADEMKRRGWLLRQELHWVKGNAMPQSTAKFTPDYEYVFWFVRNIDHYYFETPREPAAYPKAKSVNAPKKHSGYGVATYSKFKYDATKNNGLRIVRATLLVNTEQLRENHFAPFPKELVRLFIRQMSKPGDLVLDPFMGSGTTGIVAEEEARRWIGFELSPMYGEMGVTRIINERKNRMKKNRFVDLGKFLQRKQSV